MTEHVIRLFVFGLIILALPVAAVEVPFGLPDDIVTTLDGPNAVAVGDLNGDGDLDIVTSSTADGTVRLSAGHGGAVWSHGDIASTLVSPAHLALGDLDGDGDLDIVVGQETAITPIPPSDPWEAELLWLENPIIGGGGWTMRAILYLGGNVGICSVAIADVDGDGDLDVGAAWGTIGGNHLWMENDGNPDDGGWTRHDIISGDVSGPFDIELVDLDGDGDVDILSTAWNYYRVKFFENADGTGTSWIENTIDSGLVNAASVASCDLNGDGDLDVLATGIRGGTGLVWYEGSGSTWTRRNLSVAASGELHALDLDHDGDCDAVVADLEGNQLWWWENTSGDGLAGNAIMIDFALGRPIGLEVGDVDGDGDSDLITALYDDDIVEWRENQQIHRRFRADEPVMVRDGLADPRAVEAADLNSDGMIDIVTGLWVGDAITVYYQLSPTLWFEDTIGTGFNSARDVSVGDLNGDGAPDIIGAAVHGDLVRWWENGGGGYPSWTERTVLSGYNGAHRAIPADFDLDGDLDLAVAAYDGDDVSWVENVDGLGTSWTRHSLAALNGAFGLAVADYDFDGRPDIAATGYDGDDLEVYLNDGTSGWALYTVPRVIDGPRGLDTADFDGDGDADLVVVARLGNEILWFENDGAGTSSAWTEHDVGSGYFVDGAAVRAEDLDHDGDADVVATSQSGDDGYLWKNDGDGSSWTRDTFEQNLDSPLDVFVADIDADGWKDLVVAAGESDDSIGWYPNVGGQFTPSAWNHAPPRIEEGESDQVLFTVVTHQGRAGRDADLEPSGMRLLFEGPAGVAFNAVELNNIVDRLQIWRDTNRDLFFTPGIDDLVHDEVTLLSMDGVLDVVLDDGLTDLAVAPGETWGYMVVLKAASDTSAVARQELVVTILGDSVSAEDRDHDIPLTGEPMDDVSTGVIFFGRALFADDFESGDTESWSSVTGL